MPEEAIPIPQTEISKNLENDIERLGAEIAKSKEAPEMQEAGDKEIIKQALRSFTPSPAVQQSDDANTQYLPNYVADAPAPTKLEIEYLLELAFKDGIAKANALALKSSPFVLDAFHDALTGKLYPELQKRKMVD